jgi:signal transduction histidine kinase
MKPLGEAATDLPWLSPCAHSLRALARSPLPSVWPQLRYDPGLVLLIARSHRSGSLTAFPSAPRRRILRTALHFLLTVPHVRFVDWGEPVCRDIYRACLHQASLAAALAQQVSGCDPDRAWAGGMLALLGWIAVGAVAPDGVAHSLSDHAGEAFNPGAVARRLCRRWRLPGWQAAVAGYLGLPVDLAVRLGADPDLFRVIQLAVLIRQRQASQFLLPVGAEAGELLASLRLKPEQLDDAVRLVDPVVLSERRWESPGSQPLLADLLAVALRADRNGKRHSVARLHDDVDRLEEALEARCAGERRRLQVLKLSALAEFAAGAGHEINNPLAVISGQAQYLLRQLDFLDGPAEEIDNAAEYLQNLRRQLAPSLKKIVGQTQRIHTILTELMQFARPAAPAADVVDAGALIRGVATALQALADERRVRLVCPEPEAGGLLQADPTQARAALAALLRNAVEAAPPGGWAGVRAEPAAGGCRALVIEDDGPGPGPLAGDHLFDPFFSGRSAGRGRGLGLPTAWRLARQQGGDVRFDGHSAGLTRFTLVLPVAPESACRPIANGRNGATHHDG